MSKGNSGAAGGGGGDRNSVDSGSPSMVVRGRNTSKDVLPKIQRHPAYHEDLYQNSALFSFKLKHKSDAMLEQIV
jgi:hypothetical protein